MCILIADPCCCTAETNIIKQLSSKLKKNPVINYNGK